MSTKREFCEECGKIKRYSTKDNGHDPSCSKFEHWGDDSPYSDCMNGRCKYCTPDQRPTTTQTWVNSKYGIPAKGEVVIIQHENEETMPTVEIVNTSTLLRLKTDQGLWWSFYKKFKI